MGFSERTDDICSWLLLGGGTGGGGGGGEEGKDPGKTGTNVVTVVCVDTHSMASWLNLNVVHRGCAS